jgi:hypothetical protein
VEKKEKIFESAGNKLEKNATKKNLIEGMEVYKALGHTNFKCFNL